MKYYIATTLSRAAEHNVARDAIQEYGYQLTYDWTTHGSVQSVSKERLREVATLEMEAVSAADFLVVLLPGGFGTHVEIGVALGRVIPIYIHSEDPKCFDLGPQTNAFYHHPTVKQIVCPLEELAATLNGLVNQDLVPQ